MVALQPRYDDVCIDRNGRSYYCNSAWNSWARWVVLVVIVVGFFLLFALCSCVTARRRRKAGRQPFYGTGWAARPGNYGPQSQQPHYGNNNSDPPPPQYSAQGQQGSYYGNQNPQYGYQQHGVELQSPPPAHTYGGDNAYQPPAGPPPGKA